MHCVFTDKSDEVIQLLDCDNRQLLSDIKMLEYEYSSLNRELDNMRKITADRQVRRLLFVSLLSCYELINFESNDSPSLKF